MTVLRFQTGWRHQTSPASLRRVDVACCANNNYNNKTDEAILLVTKANLPFVNAGGIDKDTTLASAIPTIYEFRSKFERVQKRM